MRCSCRKCGTYMIQEEYGLNSGCKCPSCGEMCHDCMGSAQEPMDKDTLASVFALGLLAADEAEAADDAKQEESVMENWRKYL